MRRSEAGRERWPRLLTNRFVVTFTAIAIVAAAWNVYASMHNHGIVEGRVIDAAGHPVEGATVVLWVLNFTTFAETTRTRTVADGSFMISNPSSHHIQIGAEKPGVGRSARVPVRLYFRAQDIRLAAPLVLADDHFSVHDTLDQIGLKVPTRFVGKGGVCECDTLHPI